MEDAINGIIGRARTQLWSDLGKVVVNCCTATPSWSSAAEPVRCSS